MHDSRFSSSFDLGTFYSAFVKKRRIGLCFTDGNIWPLKFSNGPPKKVKGAKHGRQNF